MTLPKGIEPAEPKRKKRTSIAFRNPFKRNR